MLIVVVLLPNKERIDFFKSILEKVAQQLDHESRFVRDLAREHRLGTFHFFRRGVCTSTIMAGILSS